MFCLHSTTQIVCIWQMNRNLSNRSVNSSKCKQSMQFDKFFFNNNKTCVLKRIDGIFSYFFSDEQDRVQKKTFVNWINSHLSRVRIWTFTTVINQGVTSSSFHFYSEIRLSKFMTLLKTSKVELSF